MLCLVGGQGVGKSTFFRLLAVKDEWFSDDLRRLDDDNVYRKLQGHWIIEMSEMIATANATRACAKNPPDTGASGIGGICHSEALRRKRSEVTFWGTPYSTLRSP